MKVIQVNKWYYPHIGGVEKHVKDVAETLAPKVDMEVLVANNSRGRINETINGVKITRVPSWSVIRSAPFAPGFYSAIKQSSADIYHLHFPNPIGELAYLAAGAPGKLVLTYHCDIIRQKLLRRVYRPFLRKLLKRADTIMVSSPNIIKSSPWLQSVSEKCQVIPFGIDVKRFQLNDDISVQAKDIRESFRSPLILFLGRLIYYKGINFLIEAMKTVDAQLIIAGEGSLEHELQQQALELGISDRIHFIGSVSEKDLSAYYYASDLFVLPSTEESEAFGFVQLEAHTCGVPVVSTNLPTGVPYANLDKFTGLIVPPADSQSLASAINRLLKDDIFRHKLGKQAKKRAEDSFSLEAQGKAVLKIYRETLRSPGPGKQS
ncbi:MAG TPA: glycosyltransferase [Actinobacteria bacterium]|nr:glycosyltransferase [Actinomycetota bacterium]